MHRDISKEVLSENKHISDFTTVIKMTVDDRSGCMHRELRSGKLCQIVLCTCMPTEIVSRYSLPVTEITKENAHPQPSLSLLWHMVE